VPKEKDGELDYGNVQLRRESFSCESFLSRLGTMFSSGSFHGGGVDLPVKITQFNAYERFHQSHSQYHDWPGHLYEIGNSGPINLGRFPLVARGLTPYFDVTDAVSHWIGVGGKHSGNGLGLGMLYVFLPRFDAKLDNMEFSDGKLKLHCTVTSPDLHLAILAAGANETLRSCIPLRKRQSIKLMANPVQLKVLVVNSDSEIIDEFTETEQGASRHRVIFAGARYSTELLEMIRHGETDKVEFKQFIRIDGTKDNKANDIVKAVISFANTAGGTILIGVADNTDILGVDGHIPHDNKKAVTFFEDYFRMVRELLKTRLNRIPAISTRAELFGDKTVLVIRVEEGSAKPYFNFQTREIFVRRGANDVRPDPDSDLKLMLDSGQAGGFDSLG
jgi:hypothetical protein